MRKPFTASLIAVLMTTLTAGFAQETKVQDGKPAQSKMASSRPQKHTPDGTKSMPKSNCKRSSNAAARRSANRAKPRMLKDERAVKTR